MRYTAVFEWPEGEEPRVGRGDKWKGGELCAVQFSDALIELQALNDFADLCMEFDDYLPITLRDALAKIRPLTDEDETHNALIEATSRPYREGRLE